MPVSAPEDWWKMLRLGKWEEAGWARHSVLAAALAQTKGFWGYHGRMARTKDVWSNRIGWSAPHPTNSLRWTNLCRLRLRMLTFDLCFSPSLFSSPCTHTPPPLVLLPLPEERRNNGCRHHAVWTWRLSSSSSPPPPHHHHPAAVVCSRASTMPAARCRQFVPRVTQRLKPSGRRSPDGACRRSTEDATRAEVRDYFELPKLFDVTANSLWPRVCFNYCRSYYNCRTDAANIISSWTSATSFLTLDICYSALFWI